MAGGASPSGEPHCPRCQARTPSGARFCPACGEALEATVSVAPPLPMAPLAARAEPETVHEVSAPPPGPVSAAGSQAAAPGTVRPSQPADPLVGQVIADRYRILSLIGRGGMGVVYQVEHVHIGKLMALKLLAGELAADAGTVRRFRQEAKAISRLHHPNTVQVFDFGRAERMVYLVMEYLPGRDLAQVIAAESPLPFVRVARICAQIAASVAEAHEQGIIHRDIKPENVMIVQGRGQRDLVKVLDFGIAKLREEESGHATQAGHLLGTPHYMAPEQIRAEPIDHRVDIYALGALMYKAVTGVPAFCADTPVGVLTKHLTEPLEPPSVRSGRTDLPQVADGIVQRAMEKDPGRRYARMESLQQDLLAYLVSAGELTDPNQSGSLSRWTSTASAQAAAQPLELKVATRGDIDRYERRLRRASLVGRGLALALLLGAAGTGLWWWRGRPPAVATAEREPNDTPVQANPLTPGIAVEGYLGRRISPTHSDADVYRVRVPQGHRPVAWVQVTAIPNMDLVVDVVHRGESRPRLTADSAGLGGPEVIANFPMPGGTYYLRVREYWKAGRLPTENVSDPYQIRVELTEPGPDDEREPNDTPEQAGRLVAGEVRRGWVGWGGDVDVYCLRAAQLPAEVVLEPAGRLDLVLTRVDRQRGVRSEVDAAGAGEGERSGPLENGQPPPCVQVGARSGPQAPRSDAEHPYGLRLVPLGAGASPDAGPP